MCRFCGVDLTAENRAHDAPAPSLERVCTSADCVAKRDVACKHTLDCGHLCGGVRDEAACLPCYEGCSGVKLVADEDCTVCYTEHLVASPTIRLGCGHAFHYMCIVALLSRRWSGPRINFGFLACPLCRKELDHAALAAALGPVLKLRQQVRYTHGGGARRRAHLRTSTSPRAQVREKALLRLRYEGLDKSPEITTPGAKWFEDPAGYAVDRFACVARGVAPWRPAAHARLTPPPPHPPTPPPPHAQVL